MMIKYASRLTENVTRTTNATPLGPCCQIEPSFRIQKITYQTITIDVVWIFYVIRFTANGQEKKIIIIIRDHHVIDV